MGLERVYETVTSRGIKYGLYKRQHSDMPFVITRGGMPVVECDFLGDANREYNRIIRIYG